MNWNKKDCVAVAQTLLRLRWRALWLDCDLASGIWREAVCAIARLLAGVSEKVLTAQLRELEADGIIKRKVTRSSPPQVSYSLTVAGEELIEGLSILCAWGTHHLGIPANLPRNPKIK